MQAIDVAGGFSGEEALARAVDAVLHLFRAHEAAASHHALHAAALLPTGGTTRRTRSCTVKHTHKDAAALVSPLTASTIVDAQYPACPWLSPAGDSACGGLTGGRVAGPAASPLELPSQHHDDAAALAFEPAFPIDMLHPPFSTCLHLSAFGGATSAAAV